MVTLARPLTTTVKGSCKCFVDGKTEVDRQHAFDQFFKARYLEVFCHKKI